MAKINLKNVREAFVKAGVGNNVADLDTQKVISDAGYLLYQFDLTTVPDTVAAIPGLPNGNSPNAEDRLLVNPIVEDERVIGGTVLFSKDRKTRDPKIEFALINKSNFTSVGTLVMKIVKEKLEDGTIVLNGSFEDDEK